VRDRIESGSPPRSIFRMRTCTRTHPILRRRRLRAEETLICSIIPIYCQVPCTYWDLGLDLTGWDVIRLVNEEMGAVNEGVEAREGTEGNGVWRRRIKLESYSRSSRGSYFHNAETPTHVDEPCKGIVSFGFESEVTTRVEGRGFESIRS
jgi:hypothetical protein